MIDSDDAEEVELHDLWGKHEWHELLIHVIWNHNLYSVWFCSCGEFKDAEDCKQSFPQERLRNQDYLSTLCANIQVTHPDKTDAFRGFIRRRIHQQNSWN